MRPEIYQTGPSSRQISFFCGNPGRVGRSQRVPPMGGILSWWGSLRSTHPTMWPLSATETNYRRPRMPIITDVILACKAMSLAAVRLYEESIPKANKPVNSHDCAKAARRSHWVPRPHHVAKSSRVREVLAAPRSQRRMPSLTARGDDRSPPTLAEPRVSPTHPCMTCSGWSASLLY
jgi:hypothetical protein